MRRWAGRLIVGALLILAAIWTWNYFYPNPEKAIKQRLDDFGKAATFSSSESPVAKLQNSQRIASFCTDDVEVLVDVYGQRLIYTGQDEVFKAAMLARTQGPGSLSVEFVDPVITLSPNKKSAFVNLTIRGRIPSDRDMLVQECRFTFKKTGRAWLIRKAETVKTLSF